MLYFKNLVDKNQHQTYLVTPIRGVKKNMSIQAANNLNNTDSILLRSFLSSTLKEIMSVINAECGSLFLLDQETQELVLDSFYNSGTPKPEGKKQRIGEGISGKVVAIKTPILVKDIGKDARFSKNGYSHYRTNSFISIPLSTSKGILGVINLADKSSNEPFSEKDLEFTVAISKYACLIIENFNICGELRQEKETLSKQKTLLEQYASVGKLAAGVVHEINNPLDGVIRYSNILLEQLKDNSIAREYLLEVKKGLLRIANITKSLLEFSHQINCLKNRKYTDLHQLIDDALDTLREKRNGNILIEKKYNASLLMIADFGISHILINIIKNAFDAMPKGGLLTIATDINEKEIEIRFSDTGTGISLDIRERIFDPFFTTKSIDKGTGLGLAICKEIINKYDGKISVLSSDGKGTTFIVTIPNKHLENAQLNQ